MKRIHSIILFFVAGARTANPCPQQKEINKLRAQVVNEDPTPSVKPEELKNPDAQAFLKEVNTIIYGALPEQRPRRGLSFRRKH